MKLRADEIAMTSCKVVLFGGVGVWLLYDATLATTSEAYWTRFIGGAFVLALIFIPVFYVQKDLRARRPPTTAERISQFKKTNYFLIRVLTLVIAVIVVGLVTNIMGGAPLGADIVLVAAIAIGVAWAAVVVRVLKRLPAQKHANTR